ncbi:gp58-like family protein [Gemella sanguinis]|uniref:gp58-like family protein n=1 Tax=Gemella sanguinis TaxID=84135 RepID=UPI00352E3FD9
MDIEINGNKRAADFRNSKFQHTFTPTKANEKIKLYHMGCVGETQITHLQIEKGNDATAFEIPIKQPNALTGVFKEIRDLDLQMRDSNSDFWAKVRLNNKGMLTEFQNKELKSLLTSTADGLSVQVKKDIDKAKSEFNVRLNEINASVGGALKKSDIAITEEGISLGSETTIDGNTISSMLVAKPEGIKAITDKMIIGPAYDNLVYFDKRRSFVFNDEVIEITNLIENDVLLKSDRFQISFDVNYDGELPFNFELIMAVSSLDDRYKPYAFQLIQRGSLARNNGKIDLTLNLDNIFEEMNGVESYQFKLRQASKTNNINMTISNLKLFKKKDATLIVDGSIKGRQIAGETITGGHIKAGTIDSVNINTEAIKAQHLKVDQAMINKLLVNDMLVTNLFAKEAFIRNLKSVKISASQLEADFLRAYKGYIGGFQVGRHEKGGAWLTGENQFYVGMSNGSGDWGQTALWVNWGTRWDKVGDHAWYVKETGEMYCKNVARFSSSPEIYADLWVSGDIKYSTKAGTGHWISSPQYKKIEQKGGFAYIYYSSYGYDWWELNKEISDRRYKRDIKESKVNALEVLSKLKTYSFTKEYDGQVKDIDCGIMAQDVEQYVNQAFKQLPDDIKSYSAFEMIPYLIKGIQELTKEIEVLKHGK